MKTSCLTIKGQVTLPKELRVRFRLQPGDAVAFEPEADGIKVRPVRKTVVDWAGSLRPPELGLSEDDIRQRVRKARTGRLVSRLGHGR